MWEPAAFPPFLHSSVETQVEALGSQHRQELETERRRVEEILSRASRLETELLAKVPITMSVNKTLAAVGIGHQEGVFFGSNYYLSNRALSLLNLILSECAVSNALPIPTHFARVFFTSNLLSEKLRRHGGNGFSQMDALEAESVMRTAEMEARHRSEMLAQGEDLNAKHRADAAQREATQENEVCVIWGGEGGWVSWRFAAR